MTKQQQFKKSCKELIAYRLFFKRFRQELILNKLCESRRNFKKWKI